MRQLLAILTIVAAIATLSCTQGKQGGLSENKKRSNQPDTGYTGIEVYKKDNIKTKEVEYKNGIREGMTRTYYKGGMIEQEIQYKGGVKNGDARWLYPDGKLFRVTPYENDTINGSQIQYYKNGKIKAKIQYKEGKRYPGINEYEMNGTKVVGYPHMVYRVNDLLNEKGVYKVFIEMSDMAEGTIFYRGDFVNGFVDLKSCKQLQQTATTGYLDLVRSEGVTADSVTVIGGYLTPYGNRYYMRLAIPLPHKDLN